jgi:radical SAM protein with 4Fe4S-binding SPASM domain
MNDNTRWVLNSGVMWKGRDFGSVLWIPRQRKKVYLNPSATAAVRRLDGQATLSDIITAQSQTFRIAPEQAAHDTRRLFDRLVADGLLTDDVQRGAPVQPDQVTPPLDYITLALSNRCNLRCKHCFVSAGESRSNELQTDDWLDFIKQLPVFKLFDVVLTGGEALLHPGLWTIIDALNSAGIAVSIFTNGLLVDEEFVERAKHALINSVQISLDGVSAETHEQLRGARGSFAKASRAIQLLSQAGIPVHIAVTVTQINYAEHHHFIEIGKQLGARSVNFSEIVLNGRAQIFADQLALTAEQIAQMRLYHACKRVTERGIQVGEGLRPPDYAWDPFHPQKNNGAKRQMCSAAKDCCDINSAGDVLACQALWWDELKAGNILQTPLKDIWERAPHMTLFREMTVDQFRECNECVYKYDCGGGCRSLAYAAYQDLYAPSDEVSCAWKKIFFRRFYEEVRPQPTLDAVLAYQRALEPTAQ